MTRSLELKKPKNLSERLSLRREVNNRQFRHGARLHFPRVTLEVGRQIFSYLVPALYSELPLLMFNNANLVQIISKKLKGG